MLVVPNAAILTACSHDQANSASIGDRRANMV
jgi:hypothetical protein